MLGELIPIGMGGSIPLEKKNVLVGRSDDSDVVVRYPTVSHQHCRLILSGGYWYVKDLDSRNGTRINGVRVTDRRVDPGDILSFAKYRYELRYSPRDLGATGPPPEEDIPEDILGQSLMERAGLGGISKQKPSDDPGKTQIQ